MKLSTKLGLAALASFLPLTAFAQQSVQWDATRAILAGQGCIKDVDAFVTENGNDVSVVFTRLGISLPGGGSRVLAGRASCLARIPATIAPGYYVGQLTQSITFGVVKTARSVGNIAVQSMFAGFPVSPHRADLSYGRQINNPLMNITRQDLFSVKTTPSWYQGWCARNRAPKILYQANLGVSGQKDNAAEDLILSIDGLDLKYEVVAGLVQCQL